ncbi:class C sortase [Lachnoclostridium sp. An131]|uniref:class C sortase n=1 Tax=Lachnoclostridium sp. An131 TaxID=1965555 RepID=UPI000B36C617|nr:class C sortase [Lachnoclostridium sp. An131]OUQ24449.1 class C sortase [Lachnoclostridium sp. An131]
MKKTVSRILIGAIFLAGLSLLLYPFVANEWNTYRQQRLITGYDDTVAQLEEEGSVDYEAEWEKARAYNAELVPSVLPDSFAVAAASEEPDEEYMAALNLAGDGIMGKVEIPKIGITLPIYHTTEEEVLEKAAGHLEGSSLPSGGENTHAVISAHRGLPSAALFTDLDQLEAGDHFLIRVLDETLCYEVDQIETVEPDDTSALAVEEGEDLVTLLTCTPYGVNSHRLLVRGHRVPYEETVVAEEETPLAAVSIHTNYLLWVLVGLGVTALFILALYLLDRRARTARQKEREEKEES